MCGSGIHYSWPTRYPQLSPSLCSRTWCISSHVPQNKQLPYYTTHHGSGFHHIWSQCPTPVLPMLAYFNKFAVLALYILCLCRQFPLSTSLPVFFPRTQTGYMLRFHSLYLSNLFLPQLLYLNMTHILTHSHSRIDYDSVHT